MIKIVYLLTYMAVPLMVSWQLGYWLSVYTDKATMNDNVLVENTLIGSGSPPNTILRVVSW